MGVCQEGWIPAATGNPTVTCRADGTWGDITNKCTKPGVFSWDSVRRGSSLSPAQGCCIDSDRAPFLAVLVIRFHTPSQPSQIM